MLQASDRSLYLPESQMPPKKQTLTISSEILVLPLLSADLHHLLNVRYPNVFVESVCGVILPCQSSSLPPVTSDDLKMSENGGVDDVIEEAAVTGGNPIEDNSGVNSFDYEGPPEDEGNSNPNSFFAIKEDWYKSLTGSIIEDLKWAADASMFLKPKSSDGGGYSRGELDAIRDALHTLRSCICSIVDEWNEATNGSLSPMPFDIPKIMGLRQQMEPAEELLRTHPPPPKLEFCGHWTYDWEFPVSITRLQTNFLWLFLSPADLISTVRQSLTTMRSSCADYNVSLHLPLKRTTVPPVYMNAWTDDPYDTEKNFSSSECIHLAYPWLKMVSHPLEVALDHYKDTSAAVNFMEHYTSMDSNIKHTLDEMQQLYGSIREKMNEWATAAEAKVPKESVALVDVGGSSSHSQ